METPRELTITIGNKQLGEFITSLLGQRRTLEK